MSLLMVRLADVTVTALPAGWQIAIYLLTAIGGVLGLAGLLQLWAAPRLASRTQKLRAEAEMRLAETNATRAEIDSIGDIIRLYREEIDSLTDRVRSLNEQLTRAEATVRGTLVMLGQMDNHIDDWERAASMEADRGKALRERLITKRPTNRMP